MLSCRSAVDGVRWGLIVVMVGLVASAASPAAGQGTSASIIGQVTDASGAVLPGVTVTATSPALQVPQVTTVTNQVGEYRLAPLPIGAYEVLFELAGFQTARRQDVRLTVGFTAKIDVALGVGALAENVTVSGAAPVVDTASTSGSTLITREVLELTATTRTGAMSLLTVTPGVRSFLDVGGNQTAENPSARAFGQADEVWYTLDGVAMVEDGRTFWDYGTLAEVRVQTLGTDAEYPTRGVQMTGVVKSGGDEFHGGIQWNQSSPNFQGNNIDADLEALGITHGNSLAKQYDVSGDLGGRLVRNKLWFYGAIRRRVQENNILGAFKPDGSPSLYTASGTYVTSKVSWQMTPSNRFIFFNSTDNSLEDKGGDSLVAWEAREKKDINHPTTKVEWEGVRGSSLIATMQMGYNKHDSLVEFVNDPFIIGASDLETERVTGANLVSGEHSYRATFHTRGSLTLYKPNWFHGNHEFKSGFDYMEHNTQSGFERRPVNYHLLFNDGVPDQVSFFNFPVKPHQSAKVLWTYVRDSWTIARRLTLNLGLRYSHDNLFVPEACREAADAPSDIPFPAQCFPKVQVNIFDSVAPRLHAAFDISGKGTTVLKGGWGRYDHMQRGAGGYDRISTTYAIYDWHDLNGNKTWEINETNRNPNGGDFIGFTGNEFGGVGARLVVNPDLKQQKYDEFSIGLEQQLRTNMSIRATALYSTATNIQRRLNKFRPYSSYNVPVTNRDPGPDNRVGTADDGGSITYFEFPRTLAGAQFEEFMWINDPNADQNYKSIELAFVKRYSNRWQLNMSYSGTKKHLPMGARGSATNAGIMDLATIGDFNPNTEINTSDDTWDWDGKITGAYMFPADVMLSVNYHHTSGDAFARTVQFRGGATIPSIVLLVEPIGSQRLSNVNLVTFKFEKSFALRAAQRLKLSFSVYNALNANTATTMQQRSGGQFLHPRSIMPPRVAEVGMSFTF